MAEKALSGSTDLGLIVFKRHETIFEGYFTSSL